MPFAFAAAVIAGVSDTSFTYQGQLKRDGVPVTDTCDMRFKLRTDPNAMDEAGVIATLVLDGSGPEGGPIEIRNGLFSAELDFGAIAFGQTPIWLDVAVRCPAGAPAEYLGLLPRQPITAAPHAVQTRGIFVDDSENIGLGTASPEAKLDVRGIIRVQGAPFSNDSANIMIRKVGDRGPDNVEFALSHRSAGDELWLFGWDGSSFLNLQGWDFTNNAVQFPPGGLTMHVDLDTHRVGIGTTTPLDDLHIDGAENDGSNAGLRVQSGVDYLLFDGDEIDSSSTLFINGNSTVDTILGNGGGNVGIGTIPDKARLEVRSTNSRPTAWLMRRNPQEFSVVEILTLRTLTLGSEKNGLGGRISFRGHVPGFADSAAPNFGDIDVIRKNGGDAGEMIFRVRTAPWVNNTDEITERMRITPDFVQVKGPLHAQSSLNINSASNYANRIAPLVVGDAAGTGAAILMDGNQIEAASGIDLIINFNSAADLRLNEGGGDVGIGRSPNFQLHLSRNSAAKPTSNVWTISSDERLKKNIKAIDGALDDLLRLRGVTYQWRDPESQGRMNGRYTGMIAQEVERVFPEWIGQDANGYKTLTVIGFEGIVVEALRELREEKDRQLRKGELQIEGLRRQVAAMQERLARLEGLMATNKEDIR
ncbi:MAG: tail fiber domain-containing protein [Planctomycetes bacterium]|nr:tail fiber domain-containing protein [Planctomycetota bacterium]